MPGDNENITYTMNASNVRNGTTVAEEVKTG